jgi:hypothetical protein
MVTIIITILTITVVNTVTVIMLWNSHYLTVSSHLSSSCQLVFVHYYFTIRPCTVLFLLLALH